MDVHCQTFYHVAIVILQQPRDHVISFCMHGAVGWIYLAGKAETLLISLSNVSVHIHCSLQCHYSVVILLLAENVSD